MPIDVVRSLTSAGVGVLDEGMEWWDEKAGRTEPFRTARDLGRLAITGLGYGLQVFMPRQARLGETLALSGTPLLVKSVAKPVRSAMASRAGEQAFRPRRRAGTPAGNPPPPSSLPAGPVNLYAPEYERVLAW